MKKSFFLLVALVCISTSSTKAQLKKSSEPRPIQHPETGELILLPTILLDELATVASAVIKAAEPALIHNSAQTRSYRSGRSQNGYHKGNSSEDWGTNMHLNNFMFLPDVAD